MRRGGESGKKRGMERCRRKDVLDEYVRRPLRIVQTFSHSEFACTVTCIGKTRAKPNGMIL